MWRASGVFLLVIGVATAAAPGVVGTPRTSAQLVDSVLAHCADAGCVKVHVLQYLDNFLGIQSEDARSIQNIDNAIFKRMARIAKTHEFRMQLPGFFDGAEMVYNTKDGFDITEPINEERGLLKKKLLLPFILLFKLKMQALMPIFVGLLYMKTLKALILSKLAIVLVVGFIAYQLLGKAGMKMPLPMTMAPMEPPMPMYGPPTTPSSYEPGWEPATGGPYARLWSAGSSSSSSSDSSHGQGLAYSGYYSSISSSTVSP